MSVGRQANDSNYLGVACDTCLRIDIAGAEPCPAPGRSNVSPSYGKKHRTQGDTTTETKQLDDLWLE